MKVVAIIPAYNEEKMVASVIIGVKGEVNQVIVVDDGSTDQTALAAESAGATVLRHFLNRGQGAALQTGIDFAILNGADVIVTFDADGQHRPQDIKTVIRPILAGEADVVLGSRFLNPNLLADIPFSKRIVLRLATLFTKFYTGLKVTDVHNGFRAFSAKAMDLIQIRQDGMAHASEIIEQIQKYQLSFQEVSVEIRYTNYSKAKGQSLLNSFRIIWDLIFGRITR